MNWQECIQAEHEFSRAYLHDYFRFRYITELVKDALGSTGLIPQVAIYGYGTIKNDESADSVICIAYAWNAMEVWGFHPKLFCVVIDESVVRDPSMLTREHAARIRNILIPELQELEKIRLWLATPSHSFTSYSPEKIAVAKTLLNSIYSQIGVREESWKILSRVIPGES